MRIWKIPNTQVRIWKIPNTQVYQPLYKLTYDQTQRFIYIRYINELYGATSSQYLIIGQNHAYGVGHSLKIYDCPWMRMT